MDSVAGIMRASRQSLNDFADGKTNRIDCQMFDGLESMKFTGHAKREPVAAKTADGRIWFPNPQGLAMIDPEHFFRQQHRSSGVYPTNPHQRRRSAEPESPYPSRGRRADGVPISRS